MSINKLIDIPIVQPVIENKEKNFDSVVSNKKDVYTNTIRAKVNRLKNKGKSNG